MGIDQYGRRAPTPPSPTTNLTPFRMVDELSALNWRPPYPKKQRPRALVIRFVARNMSATNATPDQPSRFTRVRDGARGEERPPMFKQGLEARASTVATPLRHGCWLVRSHVHSVCPLVMMSVAITAHLLDTYDRYGFTRHSTRKPANERESSFTSFRRNGGFLKQTCDLANEPRAVFFTRHLRAVSLARRDGKQSVSITRER